ncbi:S8 family peptidase [Chitinophaga solisilvae]|uniref:S8 family serine peptidase n=1 Tax=Chitinophaga solisilvae TaxID=1233460 RepID=A0A433WLR7_9BACT|nr:S8 family serine peptidase [Chitinophaga solisilvae]NSL90811.1 S8 family serine peptidase [Chitinophaga solisilvae]
MKEHIIIKVVTAVRDLLPEPVPYWMDFISDKTNVVERFHPDIDRIFAEHHFRFWTTREYKPRTPGQWSSDEQASRLHLTYRLILQQHGSLPDNAIAQIRHLPFVAELRTLQIGTTEFPGEVAAALTVPATDPGDMIYLPYAKEWTKGVRDIRIAVLDTGATFSHPELEDKIVLRKNFVDLQGLDTSSFIGDVLNINALPEDQVGHGTHVSGILAARGLKMNEGVCPSCSLMVVRVLAAMRSGERIVGAGIVDNINNGIKWAVDNGADVINMSLGIKHSGGGLPHEDIVKYALSKNVTIVAASGNDGTSEKYYPGALEGVFAVGAVDNGGQVTGFTSFGANISVVAPGSNIYSSYLNNGYALSSGTSQASPFVSGAVALMKSYAAEKGKKLSNNDINYILKNTSDRLTSKVRDQRAGYGLLNLADSFKMLNAILS